MSFIPFLKLTLGGQFNWRMGGIFTSISTSN
jgi:hypothetical protein